MTQDEFDRLLAWLDADPEQAGRRYEEIRQSLIKIFNWRGCHDAEDLADQVFNRVAARLREVEGSYVGAPVHYFYGVARNLLHESRKRMKAQVPFEESGGANIPAPDYREDASDPEHECLERCTGRLDAESLELIMAYYSMDKRGKIEGRKALARQRGISTNTLRVKVHRIRAALEKCIRECLGPEVK